ncbi:hypothetical protein LguiB_009630 [Lonicera macranthoides]
MKFYKSKISLTVFIILLLSVGFIYGRGLDSNERITRSLQTPNKCYLPVFGCNPRRPGIP